MTVLAAVGEREPRRIVEARRRAVHDFGDQRERLQRARTELLDEQQRGEVAQLPLLRERQNGAEPPRLHVGRAHLVMRRHLEAPHVGERAVRILAHDLQQRVLCRARAAVHEIADRSRVLADDRRCADRR